MVVALSLEVRVLLDHAQAGTGGWLAGPFRAAEPSWCCCRRRASLGHAQGSLLGSTGSAPRAGSSRRCDSTITSTLGLCIAIQVRALNVMPGGGTFRGGHCVFLRRGQGRTPYVSANRGPIHLISGIEKTQRSHPVPDFLRFLRGLGLGGTGFSS